LSLTKDKFLQHNGSILSLQIKSSSGEGGERLIWDISDTSLFADDKWLVGQVRPNRCWVIWDISDTSLFADDKWLVGQVRRRPHRMSYRNRWVVVWPRCFLLTLSLTEVGLFAIHLFKKYLIFAKKLREFPGIRSKIFQEILKLQKNFRPGRFQSQIPIC
jgi:hypothetical protein